MTEQEEELEEEEEEENTLKAFRVKEWITHKERRIRLVPDFCTPPLNVRRQCSNIFKVLQKKNFQNTVSYSQKLLFKCKCLKYT